MKGVTLEQLADRTGYGVSYLSRVANGKRAGNAKVISAIAAALDVEPGALYAKPPASGDGIVKPAASLPARTTLERDIPILGSATGGPDGALNIDGPIDYARRPAALSRASGVYAITVSGDSMEPEFRPGMTLYVSERAEPQPGDAVVIQCRVNNGGQDQQVIAYIKLMKVKPGGVRYWQHNPPGNWEPPAPVVSVHRVYPWNELLPTY